MPDVMEVTEQPVIEKPKVTKIIRSKHENLGKKNEAEMIKFENKLQEMF